MSSDRMLLTSVFAVWVGLGGLLPSAFADSTVFSTDFETPLPAAISPGNAMLTGVQGYAGLGPTGNQFGGSFLRSATGNLVTLTLSDLPPHDRIHLDFLFAAIDSLDGTGTFPSGDFFKITLNGTQVFRESFANALPSQVQSYVSPSGVELARRVPLGFTASDLHTDSAYYLGADPIFQNFAHSGATAVFTFLIEGEGIQSLEDESWAMENLQVIVRNSASADFDNDGDVDGRDFLVWQRGGSPNGTGSGDLALWQGQYGTPLSATANAVPEPKALRLMLLAGVGWYVIVCRQEGANCFNSLGGSPT